MQVELVSPAIKIGGTSLLRHFPSSAPLVHAAPVSPQTHTPFVSSVEQVFAKSLALSVPQSVSDAPHLHSSLVQKGLEGGHEPCTHAAHDGVLASVSHLGILPVHAVAEDVVPHLHAADDVVSQMLA